MSLYKKCLTAKCFFICNSNIMNNGGNYCCRYCKYNNKGHGVCCTSKKFFFLPCLPLLTPVNREIYPEWHNYYEEVYGHPVKIDIDLNTFNWFYWTSPLGKIKTKRANFLIESQEIKINEAFIYDMYPTNVNVQAQFAKIGFFVRRNFNKDIYEKSSLEVLRSSITMFPERGVVWFFLTVGSGFRLLNSKQLVIKNRKSIVPELKPLEFDVNPYPEMLKMDIKLLVFEESEWFFREGLVEMIYRLDDPDILANDGNIPMRFGSDQENKEYKPFYSSETRILTKTVVKN